MACRPVAGHQAIIWTNAGILLISTLRNKLQWDFNRNSNIIIIQEKMPKKVVREMAVHLVWASMC